MEGEVVGTSTRGHPSSRGRGGVGREAEVIMDLESGGGR